MAVSLTQSLTGIMRRCENTLIELQYTALDFEKTCFPTFFKNYIMTYSAIERRYVMESFDELKGEMETIQQQMAEAKKNERTNVLNEVKRLCKEFVFTARTLKVRLMNEENK